MHGCFAPLHEECLQHHGHKGDLGVPTETCAAVGERSQLIPMWVGAPTKVLEAYMGKAAWPTKPTQGRKARFSQPMA